MFSGIKNESSFASLREMHIINGIFERANTLYDLGVRVELHWVPGHAHIEPHDRVDECARDDRRLAASLWPRRRDCNATRSFKVITIIPESPATALDNCKD
jgi:hypothetical protein